jgi:putative membrane protein
VVTVAAFELHPAINAALNATSAVLIVLGWRAIKAGDRDRHRALMIAAVVTSAVFLVSYLIRFATTGAHEYPGAGLDKLFYLLVLFSHMILAVVLVPLVIRAVRLGLRGDFTRHRRIVRFTFPIWIVVSVSGVVVYVMLYHLAPILP